MLAYGAVRVVRNDLAAAYASSLLHSPLLSFYSRGGGKSYVDARSPGRDASCMNASPAPDPRPRAKTRATGAKRT